MNWNLLLLKLRTRNNQLLLWELFTDIHLWNISKKDFHFKLLNYNEHNHTNVFLDSLASTSLIPLILEPIRITGHSNTLIDNIFSNVRVT